MDIFRDELLWDDAMELVFYAFKSLIRESQGDMLISRTEFSEMWNSCSMELKNTLAANAIRIL